MADDDSDRWIVSDLGDQGRNVNNWHWTEMAAEDWVKEQLQKSLLNFKVIDKNLVTCTITSVSLTGEAFITNRKGVLRAIYDLKATFTWDGVLKSSTASTSEESEKEQPLGKVSKGEVSISDLESTVKDVGQFTVKLSPLSSSSHNEHEETIWRLMEKAGLPVLKEKVVEVLTKLRAGGKYSPSEQQQQPQSMKAATASRDGTTTKAQEQKQQTLLLNNGTEQQSSMKQKAVTKFGVVELEETFNAPPNEVFECLMNDKRVQVYTRNAANIGRKEGETFMYFGGSVEGINEKIVQNELIIQKWRFKEWPDGVYSYLEIVLKKQNDGATTLLKLHQKQIPLQDKHGLPVLEKVQSGWKQFIFNGIKQIFNF